MNGELQKIRLQAMDALVKNIHIGPPLAGGWLQGSRQALGMSARQLAARTGLSQQALSALETRETLGTVSLNSLRKAAKGMGCELVYAIIPTKGKRLEDIVRRRAEAKASEIVHDVDHTMRLEGQGTGDEERKIKRVTEKLAKNPALLWD